MAKTLMTWTEPFAFVLRLRSRGHWLGRLAWMSAIALAVGLLVYFAIPRASLVGAVTAGLLAGSLLPLLFDSPYLFRQITITDSAIDWVADGVKIRFSGSLEHSKSIGIEIYRPGEWPFAFPGMKVRRLDGNWALFALPRGKSVETVAAILLRMNIPVELSGWEPTTADTRMRVEEEVALAPSTRDAVFESLSAGEEPKLNSVGVRILAAFVAAWPLLLAFPAMIAAGVVAAVYWGECDWLERVGLIGGGISTFIAAFVFVYYIGQYLEKSILIGAGLKSLRTRSSPVVDGMAGELWPVTLFARESWTKVIAKQFDFGFLQHDRRKKALVYEGDKERWTIPVTALTVLRVEEAEVGREGSSTPEVRYFVVLGTDRDGANWEIGLILARTQWGSDGPDSRRARMGFLFDELRTAIFQA